MGYRIRVQTKAAGRRVEAVEEGLRQLFRWGNLPRFRDRFAERAGFEFDRASYQLIGPLTDHPMRISELAHRSSIDVSTASRQVLQLERKGVVRRQTDVSDARASILELTPLGRRHLAKIGRARREIAATLLHDFSDDEIDLFAALLGRLAANLKRFAEGEL